MIDRRGFLAGILAAGIAPAIAGSGVLMPVRKIWTPKREPFFYIQNNTNDPMFVDIEGVRRRVEAHSVLANVNVKNGVIHAPAGSFNLQLKGVVIERTARGRY